MKTLDIGTTDLGLPFSLPMDTVTQTFAILAKRGSGKTYTARVIVEELLRLGQRVVIFDPTGAWWGIRSGSFPVLVFGGEHGDLPLTEHIGERLAHVAVKPGPSMVFDLSGLRKNAQRRFVTAFAETLYHENRSPLMVVIDEADAFAPQRVQKGEEPMLGAIEDIVRRGRIKGLGCMLISQRAAVLNKDVLTQVDTLIALRTTGPQDQDAIKDWIRSHADQEEAKAVLASLPSLGIGEAWFWSPGWMSGLWRIKIRRAHTFDSSATPKAGEPRTAPAIYELDIAAMRAEIESTIQEVEANDPTVLKRKVADLERQLRIAGEAVKALKDRSETVVEVPVLADGSIADLKRWGEAMLEMSAMIQQALPAVLSELHRVGATPRSVPKQGPAPRASGRNGAPRDPASVPAAAFADVRPVGAPDQAYGASADQLSPYARGLLATFARRHPLAITRTQLATFSKRSLKSSAFDLSLARLRKDGLITGDVEMRITDSGWAAFGGAPPAPLTLPEMQQAWRDALPKQAAKLMDVLIDRYPGGYSRQELAEASGYSITSSGFDLGVSTLKRSGLATDERGFLQATADIAEGSL